MEVEGFGGKAGPVENGGFEGEIRDEGGEIGGRAVGEGGNKGEKKAGLDGVTLEGVAGGDNDGVGHDSAGDWAYEFLGWLLPCDIGGTVGGRTVKEDFPPELVATTHI